MEGTINIRLSFVLRHKKEEETQWLIEMEVLLKALSIAVTFTFLWTEPSDINTIDDERELISKSN